MRENHERRASIINSDEINQGPLQRNNVKLKPGFLQRSLSDTAKFSIALLRLLNMYIHYPRNNVEDTKRIQI